MKCELNGVCPLFFVRHEPPEPPGRPPVSVLWLPLIATERERAHPIRYDAFSAERFGVTYRAGPIEAQPSTGMKIALGPVQAPAHLLRRLPDIAATAVEDTAPPFREEPTADSLSSDVGTGLRV